MSILGGGIGFFQKMVYKMDNAMFNHDGSAGPNYQPTTRALILPLVAGIIAGFYLVYCSFQGGKEQEEMILRQLFYALPILAGVNVLFMIKHVFDLPTWTRRFFYPIFIAVVTVVFFSLVAYVSAWIVGLVFTCLVIKVAFGAAFGTNGGSQSSSEPTYREEAVVDDGSIFGKSLYREEGRSDWHDNCGTLYEEADGGFRKKY